MTRIRLPLEHFTHVKEMPKPLKNELWALWLLHPEANTERVLMLPRSGDPFLYIKRMFRSGRASEAFVILEAELAESLRLSTMSESDIPTERTLSSVGATQYEELLYNTVEDSIKPALRSAGVRGPFTRYEAVLSPVAPALMLPHRQISYLSAPLQVRLERETGEVWHVNITDLTITSPAGVL